MPRLALTALVMSSALPTKTPPAKTSTVNVSMTEFHFALATNVVRPGTVTFRLQNNGGIRHDMSINGNGVLTVR